jgi:hypothetical protein
MTQEQPSQVEWLEGSTIWGGAEPETNEQQECLEPDLLPQPISQEAPENLCHIVGMFDPLRNPSSENRPPIKRSLTEEYCKEKRPSKISKTGVPNPGATIDHAEPTLPTPLDVGLCSRCEGFNLEIPKENCPPFKVLAKLGDVNQLLNTPKCRFCRLLHKIRPVISKPDSQNSSDCSLVLFNGEWARPWKLGPPGKSVNAFARPGICFDTFARMDKQIMFGVLPSKGVEDPRSNTVPYLHDRLFESLTRSGYIRVLQAPSRGTSEIFWPKPVGANVNWEFLRTCVKECAFNHPTTCLTDFHNGYKPLKVIDCQSRKVVNFPLNVRYLALSYVWGSEQSAKSTINQDMLPDTIPTTISDAMEVTLQLGLQFLWVDRYCIPQDQEAIKHTEIRHMDLIYRGAAATIVVCSGMSPWYGLPGCSSRLRSGSDRIRIGDQVLFSVPSDPRYEIEASNWMSRAWTYQEGLLSRRRIFFTEDQVYFECDARHCFESTAPLLNKVFWEASQKPQIFSIGGKAIGRHDFYKTVSEYSGRKLTYASDILNGVWGVLRTFQHAEDPIRHYWGVPVYYKPSHYDFIAGLAWDLSKPAQRRPGFPSWSWTGWIGQVKPGLLIKLDHAPTHNRVPSASPFPLTPSLLLPAYDLATSPLPEFPPIRTPESETVETPKDILQTNLPSPVEEDMDIRARRMDGSLLPYKTALIEYSEYGGHGLSHLLYIDTWMIPATVSTSGRPKITISPPPHHRSSLDTGSHYDSLEWLPTLEETTPQRLEKLARPCTAILLATREPLVVERRRRESPMPRSDIDVDPDLNEGEVLNNSWLCLFLIVEYRESPVPCFERVGLAKFMFPEKMSMQALIQDLKLEKKGIYLG